MSSTNKVRAALLLTNRLFTTDEKPLSPGEFWRLTSAVNDLGGLLEASGPEIEGAIGGDSGLARRVGGRINLTTKRGPLTYSHGLDELRHSG
jgi:23S rRNA pseudoU1915 N3-methylase RlmH